MKAVIVRIQNKKATVLSDSGKFLQIPYKKGMQVGMRIYLNNPLQRLPKMFNMAACLAAFAFALMFLLFYIRLLSH